ncbi:EAL and HDOD domain-containing protein [Undibacterium parvum]|uniref:EAL domain-containing protein n=2 Tax=Undibacterium TaxID=401469 RepID=A0A6M4A425_9BURK|nr:EAL domain-containing protein [Undibacterium parvum]AZP10716.1 EAL domain-containing protein [Undibacterium parvum]QJQ05327.1 EAL domain-containing protein [Undibacterium piscinae]
MSDPANSQQHKAMDFFLARQPILNRQQSLTAYELLFRSAALGPAGVVDDVAATASVIEHASELGLDNVIGSSLGFFNVDTKVLLSDFIQFLPRDKVVLEILETVEATDEVVARVAELLALGYKFALDDVIADSPCLRKLLPMIEIIKIDIMGMSRSDLTALYQQFKGANKKMLAEKVETLDEFNFCMNLGFDYFQGYYFAKPLILTGKKLSPSQLAIMRLMALIVADADTAVIELAIKHDASLGLNLLRLVNTPAFLTSQRIESLRQALAVLGRRQLQRWLQILLYAAPGKVDSFMSPLLMLATSRGKLMELITQQIMPRNQTAADTAFTVGIMSLMDTLFSSPMPQILDQVSVVEEVKLALLERRGQYGEILHLIEQIEVLDQDEAAAALLLAELQQIGISKETLFELQVQAFEWSDEISRSVA